MEQLAIVIGIIGVVINLVAYGMLTRGKLRANEAHYQLLNLLGTCGILVSFLAEWNVASFVMNIAWLLICLFALLRMYLKRASDV